MQSGAVFIFAEMKFNFQRPVLLFALIFSVLISVQCYYLYNTAQLWKAEVFRDVRNRLDGFDSGATSKIADEEAAEAIGQYEEGSLSKNDFVEHYRTREKFKTADISGKVDSLFKDDGYQVAFAKQITSIYSYQTKKELLEEPITLFATENSTAQGKIVSEGNWDTSTWTRNTEKPENDKKYHFTVADKTVFNILNINQIISLKLAPQILLNMLISGLILYLFSRTLKNVKNQEQKITQLHTTIDSITHELNTPVTTLKFALQKIENPDTKSIFFRQIKRMEEITAAVHAQNSDAELVTEDVMNGYLSEVKDRFFHVQILVEKTFHSNTKILFSDFKILIDNLIDNAAKYGASTVWLETVFDHSTKITVADDGSGIPAGEHIQIFKKYYRIPGRQYSEISGLGLGLYLVRQTVQKYGGKVAAISNAERGVTFRIEIPN